MMPENSHSYLEIGILRGECLVEVEPWCDTAIAVDPDPKCALYVPDGVTFWNMTSDEFFHKYDGSDVDVIFIDGDHSEDQAARDFRNALTVLAPKGVIALHDSYPWTNGTPATHLCGEVYKVVDAISQDSNLSSVTIPRFPGVTLVTVNGD